AQKNSPSFRPSGWLALTSTTASPLAMINIGIASIGNAAMKKKLTDSDIKQGKDFKPRDDQFGVFDAAMPGFGVRVSPHGVKSFIYMYRFGGQLRRATLGRYPPLSLADARKKVAEIDDAVSEGRDPRVEKQQGNVEDAAKHG